MFFDEWDSEEYNRFLNLAFRCVQLYLQIGLVQTPNNDLTTRQYRAQMGESFMLWADQYFTEPLDSGTSTVTRLEQRISRHEMHKDYEKVVGTKFSGSPQMFKKRLLAFCKYNQFIFNPGLPKVDKKTKIVLSQHGGREVSGGVEYFTVLSPINN